MKTFLFFLLFPFLLTAGYNELPMETWGADSDLYKMPSTPPPPLTVSRRVCNRMIRFYQNVISPIDGPRSNYKPSSSEYARQAICKYGFFKGFVLGCDRLMRENKAEWCYPIVETSEGARKSDPLR